MTALKTTYLSMAIVAIAALSFVFPAAAVDLGEVARLLDGPVHSDSPATISIRPGVERDRRERPLDLLEGPLASRDEAPARHWQQYVSRNSSFQQQQGLLWEERLSNGEVIPFRETGRTVAYVELYDSRRSLHVRIYANRVVWRQARSHRWHNVPDSEGRWVAPVRLQMIPIQPISIPQADEVRDGGTGFRIAYYGPLSKYWSSREEKFLHMALCDALSNLTIEEYWNVADREAWRGKIERKELKRKIFGLFHLSRCPSSETRGLVVIGLTRLNNPDAAGMCYGPSSISINPDIIPDGEPGWHTMNDPQYAYLVSVIAHELLHCFGLDHGDSSGTYTESYRGYFIEALQIAIESDIGPHSDDGNDWIGWNDDPSSLRLHRGRCRRHVKD